MCYLARKEKAVNDLNFNIHAFTHPSTGAEYSALLDEAIRMGEELEAMIDHNSAWLAANAATKPCQSKAD